MAKRYIRINWQNRPNVATPISATNLNKMDKGIDDIDNAIEEIYNKRVNNVVTTNPDTFLAGPVGKTLQDQITTLNNDLFQKSFSDKSIKYEGDTSIIDNYSNVVTNYSEYSVMLTFGVTHPTLHGSAGLIHGFKVNSNYEFQEFKSAYRNMYRHKVDGTWGAWTSV